MKTLPLSAYIVRNFRCLAKLLGIWMLVSIQASGQPQIETLTPAKSKSRSTLSLQGTNFSLIPANNLVTFGGVRASVTAATANNLSVTLPTCATFGPVSVMVDGLAGMSRQFFSSALPTSGNLLTNGFGPYAEAAVTGNQQWLAAGDLDGDGRMDLVSIYYVGQTLSILRNVGSSGSLTSSSFAAHVDLPTWGNPYSVALGDVDGDGKLDILVANRAGMVSVYRNISVPGVLNAASFAARVDFAAGNADLRTISLGDLDGDGKLDAAIGCGNGAVVILRNTGTIGVPGFAAPFSLPGGGQVFQIALGDIDGDGKLDLITCNYDAYNASVYRNRSTPGALSSASFEVRFVLGLGFYPNGIALADMDGDDKLDLLCMNNQGGNIGIYRNVGSPSTPTASIFAAPAIITAAFNSSRIAVGDVNGDGKPDVVVASHDQNAVSIFLNRSTGPGIDVNTLATRVDYPIGGNPHLVLLADLDGDGKLDIAAAREINNYVSILHNNLPAPPMVDSHPASQTVQAGDTVTLTAVVSGGDPLSCQWRLNGVNVPGAASSSLVLQNALASQSGVYSLVVTNTAGVAYSSNAVVLIDRVPVTGSQSVSVNEDSSVALTLAATDADNDALTFIVTSPAHGRLTGTPPSVTYSPNPDYNGPDSFTFQVTDGTFSSAVATVSITVLPVNDPPTAFSQALALDEDSTAAIVLAGSDPDGDALTFLINPAQHGTLFGVPPNMFYRPLTNYFGPDSFTFAVNDGTVSSANATVSITVRPVNDAPVATAQSISVNEDSSVTFTLAASDVENDPLTFVLSTPAHGQLSGVPPLVTYTPNHDYNGADSFTFQASDGSLSSEVATVSVNVLPVNDAPIAFAQAVALDEDSLLPIDLAGSDVDGDSLTFAVTQPQHGSVSGTPPHVVYTPAADYFGADSFTFTVNDGTVSSSAATVSITVRPVNDAPVAQSQSVSLNEDSTVSITLAATDVENDPLTFLVSPPAHGLLTGSPPALTYAPYPDYNGPDAFTFRASDGSLTSAVATVSITVLPVNDAPTAFSQAVIVSESSTVGIVLAGADIDGDALTFVVGQPQHGTLSGVPPNLVYRPELEYSGADSFTFVANDGTVDSALATVSVTVRPVNHAPVAQSQTVSVIEDGSVALTLSATDRDNDPITFVVSAPLHGRLVGTAPSLTYYPNTNYSGPDSFRFQATDGSLLSPAANVSITVTPVNDAPIAVSQAVTMDKNTTLAISLQSSDPDGDRLSYTVTEPQHGTLSGTAPNVVYKPAANYFGNDSFTFTVSDGKLASAPATVTIAVRKVNLPPVAHLTATPLYSMPVSTSRVTALAVNRVSAVITLDSAGSSDPENETLEISWLETTSKPFATSARTTQVLALGSHPITLNVKAGHSTAKAKLIILVVKPSAVVKDMLPILDAAKMKKKDPTVKAAFQAAMTSLDKDDTTAGLAQLRDLQNKVRAQIAPFDANTATRLINSLQTLIDRMAAP